MLNNSPTEKFVCLTCEVSAQQAEIEEKTRWCKFCKENHECNFQPKFKLIQQNGRDKVSIYVTYIEGVRLETVLRLQIESLQPSKSKNKTHELLVFRRLYQIFFCNNNFLNLLEKQPNYLYLEIDDAWLISESWSISGFSDFISNLISKNQIDGVV